MAKRFTDTDIWDKEWFMKLTTVEKCLVRFIFDKCDAAGIWSPNWPLASAYIGVPVDLNTLASFSYRLEFLGEKVFIPDFISFQYGTLSENCKPHIKIIETLKKYGLLERVSKGYTKPLQRFEDMDKEKEEEKDKKGKGKKADKIEIIYPFDSEVFLNAWQLWKDYKKKEHGFSYKSELSEQAALKELSELSESDEQLAIDIINQSIKKGWKGFFEIKNKSNGNSNNKPWLNTQAVGMLTDELFKQKQPVGSNPVSGGT